MWLENMLPNVSPHLSRISQRGTDATVISARPILQVTLKFAHGLWDLVGVVVYPMLFVSSSELARK